MFYIIIALLILAVFYGVYLGKIILQKRKGIRTDQIARGKMRGRRFYIELIMKIATYSIVAVQVASVFLGVALLSIPWRCVGIVIAVLGDILFAFSVYTMRDNWRAGIAENEKTEFVNYGIYFMSRNPAFLGFDLMYIGLLLIFFNPVLLVFSLWAIIMLHLQILQEEKHLQSVFGEAYWAYKGKVRRYFGRYKRR